MEVMYIRPEQLPAAEDLINYAGVRFTPPQDAEIYTAPRPMPGTPIERGMMSMQLKGVGFHWAFIDPRDPDAEQWRREIEDLRGKRVVVVTIEEAATFLKDYYQREYSYGMEDVESLLAGASEREIWDSFVNARRKQ
jgi:hypothetical protein